MREALVADLRQRRIINEDGMVHADRLNQWLRPDDRGRTVDLFPGLRNDLGSLGAAQRTYDQVVADQAARLADFNKQAAAEHIARVKGLEGDLKAFDRQAAAARNAEVGEFNRTAGQFVGSEPWDALKRLFASKTRTQDFTDVVNRARGNPEVVDGLKRLTADYIEQRFSSAKPSGDGTDFLKAGEFRKFIDDRREPLKVIFGGQGLQNLEMVAADLRRQGMGTPGAAVPGSDTVTKALGAAKAGHAAGGGITTTAFALIGEHLLEHGAELVSHHPAVAAVAAPLGVVSGLLLHSFRQAGIHTRNDLIREAMLHPAVAREMMQRAASRNAINPLAQRRIARAIQSSIINNAVGQNDAR